MDENHFGGETEMGVDMAQGPMQARTGRIMTNMQPKQGGTQIAV